MAGVTQDLTDIRKRLAEVPDPVGFLAGLFAQSPVALQIYKADGHCLLVNAAFRRLFGAEPPPEYNVLEDELAREQGVLALIHRAFAGETLETPPIWYDPRELRQVRVTEGRRVAISAAFFPVRDGAGRVTHVGILFQDVTAELTAREAAEKGRAEAEAIQRRFAFLAEASEALSESLDYVGNLRKLASLAVPAIADWCTVVVRDPEGRFRRIAVVHRDPAKQDLAREYETRFPPGDHRASRSQDALAGGKPVMLSQVELSHLEEAAQDPEHLRLMQGLGVASCIIVPLRSRSRLLGAISLMRMEGSPRYGEGELELAKELARRASGAIENSRLYDEERRARQEADAARAEVQLERQRLNAVLQQMPSALAIVEAPSGKVLLWNEHHSEILGADVPLSGAEIDEHRRFHGLHPDGRPFEPHEWPISRAITRGEVVQGEEIEIARSDGTRRYIRANAGPVRDDTGRIVAGVLTYDDVTEERHAKEQAAFLSEASKLLASSLDFETTLKTVVQLAVPRLADWCALDLLGPEGTLSLLAVAHVDPAKVELARELRKRYPPNPNAPRGVWHVLRTGMAEVTEEIPDELLVASAVDAEHLRIFRALGLRSAMAVPIRGHTGVIGVLGLVYAESGRRFTQADLSFAEELANRIGLAIANATLYREAREAIRQRDDFLSVASHELKTPLTSLDLTVANLRRALDAGRLRSLTPDALGERLAKVSRQAARLKTLINQLLDVSRIAAGRIELDRQPVDLSELAAEVVARFREEAERSGTPLALSAERPVVGSWDRDRLDQVLTNLIANALKYGAGRLISVAVRAGPEGLAELTVRDQGIGIDPEHQARIFDRFERAVSARNYGGLGLGLWITRQIVDAHGGQVSVRSTPGAGATFVVLLPLG